MNFLVFLALFFVNSMTCHATNKVVYGEDNRIDIVEATSNIYVELAKSTAGRITPSRLKVKDNVVTITGDSLVSRGICSDERFANQISATDCSGFLVGEDLLVTAGHCMRDMRDCSGYRWVFDFKYDGSDTYEVPQSSVYECAEIVDQKLSRITKEDYALIRLDRKVTDREPLRVRKTGRIADGTELFIIGHPTGLPTKVADGAAVRTNTNDYYFVSNLDSFGGNSGSAVFDADSGTVEGILVRGEVDYVYDPSAGCRRVKQCDSDSCRGEDVTRITRVAKLMETLNN